MVFAILLIACSGFLFVGNVKGWFEKGNAQEYFVVEEQTGNASIQRSGISYALKSGTILQGGDRIETLKNSRLRFGRQKSDHTINVNENTLFSVDHCSESALSIQLMRGEFYIEKGGDKSSFDIQFGHNRVRERKEKAVFTLDVQEGSQTICILKGSVSVENSSKTIVVSSGHCYCNVKGKDEQETASVTVLSPSTLNDFFLKQTLFTSEHGNVCFTTEQIRRIQKERKQEKTSANEALLTIRKDKAGKQEKVSGIQKETVKDQKESTGEKYSTLPPVIQEQNPDNQSGKTVNSQHKKNSSSKKSELEKDNPKSSSTPATTSKKPQPNGSDNKKEEPEQQEPKSDMKVYTCTISISCNSILEHMENLKRGKGSYVPEDGCVLETTKVEFEEGETVYDVLKRVCDTLHIQMEASYTPLYKSYYVEGIHNLYEFDCGAQSGWMYKVNGWYPNYGCSSYELKDGDSIAWNYTCEGLGEDLS